MSNFKFKKSLVAVAAGVALAGAGITAANANSLLFPYFTTNNGAQTALSLSTDGSTRATTANDLHYVFNYGASCTHYDARGSMTPNDLLQASVADPSVGGFGKAVASDTSTPVYFPLANQYGFLVVTDTVSASTTAISGDVAIVDPSTGLVAAYAGITNGLATDAAAHATSEGDFSAMTTLNYGLSFYPNTAVTTSWYSVMVGDMNTAITNGRNWTAAATLSNNGNVYGNDEQAFSGTMTKAVSCAGTVAPTDLMTGAQSAKVGPNGGLLNATWAPTALSATVLDTTTGVVMYKMQLVSASVGAPFAGKEFMFQQQ